MIEWVSVRKRDPHRFTEIIIGRDIHSHLPTTIPGYFDGEH